MTSRRRWAVAIVLLLLLVGGFAGWGFVLAAKYGGRLGAIRALGEPTTWADLAGEPVPDDENGAAFVEKADQAWKVVEKAVVESAASSSRTGTLGIPSYDRKNPWSEEDRALVAECLRNLEPCFSLLEKALSRPVFAPRMGRDSEDYRGVLSALVAARSWALRGSFDAAQASASIDHMLTMADRWRIREGTEFYLRGGLRGQALELLRDRIAAGALGSSAPRSAWDALLGRAEKSLPAGARTEALTERVVMIEIFESWRDGEPWRHRFGPAPPWYSRWWGCWGEPFLYMDALGTLDECDERVRRVRDEASMRRGLQSSDFTASSALRQWVRLRLARVAMAIDAEVQAGAGARTRIDDFAASLGRSTVTDPRTGLAFRLDREGDRFFLSAEDPSAAPAAESPSSRRERLRDENLEWEVRLGR